MKVLYDISVLGIGHFLPRARTGIFRVVEQTALGLATAADLQVAFCASEGNYSQCITYLQDSQLLVPYQRTLPRNLCVHYGELVSKLPGGTASSPSYYTVKGMLGLLPYCTRGFISPLANVDWQNIHIYHAPFFPIPETVRKQSRITSFQSVYDLIPILHPQFFKFNEDHLIKRVVSSLTADDYILAISESTKNDLCTYQARIDPAKVFVVPLAASENFYPCTDPGTLGDIRTKYGIPGEGDYFLSVSTLEPRKNIDKVIRCFVRIILEEHLPDLYLVLAGSKGWDYDRIFAEIPDAPEIREKIIVTGYVPDEDLAPLYSGALAFVYPSFYEGFGLPPLEAMQCGTPVITSNTSSLPEVVGDAGSMVDPNDFEALCQAMLTVYREPSLREMMSSKSLDRARQFSWEKYMQSVSNAYKMAL